MVRLSSSRVALLVASLGLGRGLLSPKPVRRSTQARGQAPTSVSTSDAARETTARRPVSPDVHAPPPWARTIATESDAPLLYGNFYQWQLELLQSALGAEPLALPDELALQVNEGKQARVGSACFESPLFRKVRMTYFDAGESVQVFNSLWYPRFDIDAPVLGIDLLCFGASKVLAVVDCQPLDGRGAAGADAGTSPFRTIRDKYPSLCGTMSNRYYDANQFFSDAMLFGRFEAPRDEAALEAGHPIDRELFPAYQEYVRAYVDLVKTTPRDPAVAAGVRERQRAYDQYSADRDPAHALFKGYFGAAWADSLMHDLLFDLSCPERTKQAHAEMAQRKTSKGSGGGGGNPFA